MNPNFFERAGQILHGAFAEVDQKVDMVRAAGYPLADFDPGTRTRPRYTDLERVLLDLADKVFNAAEGEHREQATRELVDAVEQATPGVVLDDGRVVRVQRDGRVVVFDSAEAFDRLHWGPGGRTRGRPAKPQAWQFQLPGGVAAERTQDEQVTVAVAEGVQQRMGGGR